MRSALVRMARTNQDLLQSVEVPLSRSAHSKETGRDSWSRTFFGPAVKSREFVASRGGDLGTNLQVRCLLESWVGHSLIRELDSDKFQTFEWGDTRDT